MKLSIAVQTPEVEPLVPVALATGALEEKIEKAARWGADGVELMTVIPRALDWHSLRDSLTQHGCAAAAIASGAMGFAAGITLLNSDPAVMALARARLTDLIDLAAALHAPVVTIGSFRGRLAALPDGRGREVLCHILREAADYAGERGVRLALEAINRYETDQFHTAQQVLDFIAEVDRPALGVLLDTFHMNIEEASFVEPFECAADRGKLFHVHLGDNNRLPTGQGMLDFAAIVRTLRRLGYDGYLSAELLARPDADTAAQQTLAYMRRLLDAA